MAIDTLERRRSAIAVTTPDRVPLPDGAVDEADRSTLTGRYSGFAGQAVVDAPVTLTIRDRHHTATIGGWGHTATSRARHHTGTIREQP